jgi:hypothetical protein
LFFRKHAGFVRKKYHANAHTAAPPAPQKLHPRKMSQAGRGGRLRTASFQAIPEAKTLPITNHHPFLSELWGVKEEIMSWLRRREWRDGKEARPGRRRETGAKGYWSACHRRRVTHPHRNGQSAETNATTRHGCRPSLIAECAVRSPHNTSHRRHMKHRETEAKNCAIPQHS